MIQRRKSVVNQLQTNGLDAPKGMVAPTLFIGVGGTGAEIVGRVKNRVDLLTDNTGTG